jgi:hypothetical protein
LGRRWRSRRGRRCFNGGRIINCRGHGGEGDTEREGVGPVPARARQRQRPSAPPVHDAPATAVLR